MTCPDCERTAMALARLRAKHKAYADETNQLLTEQAQQILDLRAAVDTSSTQAEAS